MTDKGWVLSPHVVVVTGCAECSIIEDYRCDREGRDHAWAFSIECPGADVGHCQAFEECGEKDCPLYYLAAGSDRDEWLEEHNPDRDEVVVHGKRHVPMDEWAVETTRCWIQVCDGTPDEVADLGITEPGRYPVHHDSGWEDLRLTLVVGDSVTALARVSTGGERP